MLKVKTQQVLVRMPVELVEKLDAKAVRKHVSRSVIIKQACRRDLEDAA
jgi:metal-responsive CopG/Arc/MetJ family transcriptional regulator